MRSKGNRPKRQIRGREVKLEDFSTMEVIAEREKVREDNSNVEALEQVSQDFWGRSGEQTDGGIPIEPPDTDPLVLQPPRKPKGPPAHNM